MRVSLHVDIYIVCVRVCVCVCVLCVVCAHVLSMCCVRIPLETTLKDMADALIALKLVK